MEEYWEVRWDSWGAHGAHSSGSIGPKFATKEEAEARMRQEAEEFRAAYKNMPHAETDFSVVYVTDSDGNSVCV